MPAAMLQELCQLGSDELIGMNYLAAAKWLKQAAVLARQQQDWDTLSRVYMPLQEARRQRRLRCGEGVSHLGLIAEQEDDQIDGRRVVENYPQGQLLVAGWGSIEPAKKVRELQKQYELYVETFLGAVYPTDQGRVVAIVPNCEAALPPPTLRTVEELQSLLPPNCLIRMAADLPELPKKGDAQTFARASALWEELHRPYLATADALPDGVDKIDAYVSTIAVDYGCELAHQNLSKTAHRLLRAKRAS